MLADSVNFSDLMIGGLNIIVEIDETKFGKRKYHRGHRLDGVWVISGFERTTQRRILCVSVKKENMKQFLMF
jgi:hypothetical protein